MKSVILSLHNDFLKGRSIQGVISDAKVKAQEYAFTNSIITSIFPESYNFEQDKLLSCIPYSLKDNISTKGIRTTGGSLFLENYIPPFNATIYELLNNEGATLVSKDAMDEFGLGGTGLHCAYGKVCNPLDKTKIIGGSSSGSAVNVMTGISAFAIGTDTGDSVRRPASLGGIVGYKPSYGAISRYGVFPYAPSFDHVGILAKYVADATIVASYLIKHDAKDATSYDKIKDVSLENLKPLKKIQFVYIKNWLNFLDEKQKSKFDEFLQYLVKDGHYIKGVEVDPKILTAISFAYKVLTYTEGYSCYSNLQGITFGINQNNENNTYFESLKKIRTAGIGDEVKRRFVIGAYLTAKENYGNLTLAAKSIRRQVQEIEMNLLKEGDCILMPSVCGTAIDINHPNEQSIYDNWLMFANFSGTPSITIPFSTLHSLPYGLTISAEMYNDMKLLQIAYTLEEKIGGNND